MNRCQMSNNINTSAPSSPTGTIAAKSTDQQQASDNQQPRLSRSRSLSDISQGDSPRQEDLQQHQQSPPDQKVATEGLKVKIKTNNILNNNTNSTVKDENGNHNNNNCINNIKPNNESTNIKTNNSNNKVIRGKANKPTNGGNNNITNSKSTSGNSDNLLGNNITGKDDIKDPETNMTNHAGSISADENGKSSAPPQQSTFTPPVQSQSLTQPQQNPQSLQPAQAQSQQQLPLPPPTLPPPHPLSAQSKPQPQTANTPQSPTVVSKKPASTSAAPVEPKPKTTRARKQINASNKGANSSSVTTKPESKRARKAKQNSETTTTNKPTTVPSQPVPPISSTLAAPSSTPDDKNATSSQQSPTVPSTKKRKPRATAASLSAAPTTNNQSALPAATPPKRTRKKKGDQTATITDNNNNPPPLTATSITFPLNVANPQLLSVASNVPVGTSPMMSTAPLPPMQQPNINRQVPGISPLDVHDPASRYYSLTISPYANYDYSNASSLTRPSLSRLFTSSSSAEIGQINSHSDEISRAFEDLRDNSWSHLSKCILEQAQQFDIPSLIGTLYTLRSENEKLINKVRDLTNKREQLVAMNARLDLPGPMLTQHLNHTSPNFSAVVAGLTNSPKSLPNSSPSPAMNKSPIVAGVSYNHVPPGSSLGPPSFIDRSSPLVGLQTPHSGVNSLKSSSISTPSPPTGALMAHGANNRASLMTVNNPPYMSNVHPSINALNQLGGPNPPSSSYYPRQ